MPPRIHVKALQYLSSKQISGHIISVLLDIEKEAVLIQKQQQQNGTDPSIHAAKFIKLKENYLEFVEFLNSLPGALLEKINETCLESYKEKYEKIDKGQVLV